MRAKQFEKLERLLKKVLKVAPFCNNWASATDCTVMSIKSPLVEFLPYQLAITSGAVSGRIASEYRKRFGLTIPEWRAMAVIHDYGPLTQRDVTHLAATDKVAVNRACKVLEDRQLVQRRPNVQDGRSHLLEITEEGRRTHDTIMPRAMEMETQLLESFTPEEIAQFRHFLKRLRNEALRLADDRVYVAEAAE